MTGKYTLILTGKTRRELDEAALKQGLLTLCAGNSKRAKQLVNSAPKIIYASDSLAEAKKRLAATWRLGWHTEIRNQNSLIYSSLTSQKKKAVENGQGLSQSAAQCSTEENEPAPVARANAARGRTNSNHASQSKATGQPTSGVQKPKRKASAKGLTGESLAKQAIAGGSRRDEGLFSSKAATPSTVKRERSLTSLSSGPAPSHPADSSAEESSRVIAKPLSQSSSNTTAALKSADGSIGVALPKGWAPMSTLNPTADLQLGAKGSDAFAIVIKQLRPESGDLVELSAYAKATCQAALGWVSQSELRNEPSRVSNNRFYEAEIAGVIGETAVVYHLSVHLSERYFAVLYAWTSEQQFDAMKPVFTALSDSLILANNPVVETISDLEPA